MTVSSSDLLNAARSAFDLWRSNNSKHARIPAHLWQQAIALVDLFPLSVVARELRLNPARLRRSLKASSASPCRATPPAQPFLQIPAADLNLLNSSVSNISANNDPLIDSDAATLRLVIERFDGCRLSLSVPASNWPHLESLCHSFLRSR